MNKWIKAVLAIILVIILSIVTTLWIVDRPIPEGVSGPEADKLANKMLKQINSEAWENTKWVKWTFRGKHHYIWDRERKLVSVQWDNTTVLMDLSDRSQSKVYIDGALQNSPEVIETAWAYFINDAFWLSAPTKVFEEGTQRYVVERKKGPPALRITYTSGGVTPGDTYLWILDEEGMPVAFRMWVSILPIGGLKATWEDWKVTSTGAKIAQSHKLLSLNITIDNLGTGDDMKSIGVTQDPFSEFSNRDN